MGHCHDDVLCTCGPKRDPEPEPLVELFRSEGHRIHPEAAWSSPWKTTYDEARVFGEAAIRAGEWRSFGINRRFFAPGTHPEAAGV